jgi:hypothetical protein
VFRMNHAEPPGRRKVQTESVRQSKDTAEITGIHH